MYKKILTVVSLAVFLFLLSCTVESIGRKLDPGYDEYLNRRTFDQKLEDEKKKEEIINNNAKRRK